MSRPSQTRPRRLSKPVKKATNYSTKEVLMSKNWMRSIYHEKELMNLISTEDLKKEVIEWMLIWAPKPEAETVLDFCIEHKIPRSTLYYWAEKDKDFKAAFDLMKLILGNKLYKGALHREIDRETAFKTMHCLDPEYKEINAYHAALKKSESVNSDAQAIADAVKLVMGPLTKEEERDEKV